MSKYIKDCNIIKKCHFNPNEISFKAENITVVSTRMEEIISGNKENIDQRYPYDTR